MNAQSYLDAVQVVLHDIPLVQLSQLVELLRKTRDSGRRVYTIGNGGSAATASHFAVDLNKAAGMKAFALTDSAMLSAYGNDWGYASTFAGQLMRLFEVDDVLVVFSVSAESPNVVEAAERFFGLRVVAFTGKEGGRLKDLADIELRIPNTTYGITEDLHLMLCHMAIEELR